jgi:hypothetical protein
MRLLLCFVAYSILTLMPIGAYAGDPINNLEEVRVGVKLNGEQPTVAEVQSAIIRATRARGWAPQPEGEGKIVASILVRGRHYAEVDIPFDAFGFSIIYRTSRELEFNERKQTIHGNYNRWVALLARDINQQITALPAPTTP